MSFLRTTIRPIELWQSLVYKNTRGINRWLGYNYILSCETLATRSLIVGHIQGFAQKYIHAVVALDERVSGSFVHDQRATLPVSSEAELALERSLLRVNQLMLVQTRVLGESSIAIFHRARVWLFTRVDADVIFVICRAGECLAALIAFVRTLPCVRPDVNFSDIRRRERTSAAVERTDEGSLARVRPHVFQ